MKIAIGSDHAGYPYKEPIKELLAKRGMEIIDFGTTGTESVDYPVFAIKVGEAVRDGFANLGILICGTGIGMSIAANKVRGIRAGACQTDFAAKAMKEHNNANIICFGSRTNTIEEVLRFTDIFLDSSYQDGRHQRRIDLITAYEERK